MLLDCQGVIVSYPTALWASTRSDIRIVQSMPCRLASDIFNVSNFFWAGQARYCLNIRLSSSVALYRACSGMAESSRRCRTWPPQPARARAAGGGRSFTRSSQLMQAAIVEHAQKLGLTVGAA